MHLNTYKFKRSFPTVQWKKKVSLLGNVFWGVKKIIFKEMIFELHFNSTHTSAKIR